MAMPFRFDAAAAAPLERALEICEQSLTFPIRFRPLRPPGCQVDVKPRKSPRQTRAKATVDAIIEATTQVLLDEGYDRFTTARVAERAGVSIGSLYQYFPNKAALASAVIDRCCEDFLVVFERTLAGRRRATLAESIRAIIDVAVVSHHLTPALHRIVRDLAPRLGAAERTEAVSRAAAAMIESMLREHADEIAPAIDLAVAATIIETVLEALAHRVQLATPALVPDGTLADEAVRLITRYLAAPVEARGIRRRMPPN